MAAAAAAVLLGGCSGGGEGREPARADGPATASSSAATEEKSSSSTERATPKGPKVPESELTPATGSFTKKEKEYLADRVPEGMDPAAVLQIGQETCQRISRTAEHDRDAAVDAIRTGEIANAESAITHLCPEQRPLLEAAKKGSTE
jgi:hypothetical protein